MLLRSLALLIFSNSVCFAASPVRAGLLMGTSAATVTVDSSVNVNETALSFFLDYAMDPSISLGAEHIRGTALTSKTSVSTSGLVAKYYFLSTIPQYSNANLYKSATQIVQKSWTPYTGIGFGFTQTSLVERNTSQAAATGVFGYGLFQLGLEYPVWDRYGTRLSLDYGTSFGSQGSTQFQRLLIGFYFYL